MRKSVRCIFGRPETHPVKKIVAFTEEMIAEVEEWRAKQRPLPNRSDPWVGRTRAQGEAMTGAIESWTPRDDKWLMELVAAGAGWEAIGRRLARTPRAVQSRAKKLKLPISHARWKDKSVHAGKVSLPKPQVRPSEK